MGTEETALLRRIRAATARSADAASVRDAAIEEIAAAEREKIRAKRALESLRRRAVAR